MSSQVIFRLDQLHIDVKLQFVSPHLDKGVPLPKAETDGSAGVDLSACIEDPVHIEPGDSRLIPTGIAIALPGPFVGAFIFARSGLASKHGIRLANSVGVIDSDYRGEIKVPLRNDGRDVFTVNNGDRIAQMVFLPVYTASWLVVDTLDETSRGAGGFGHTGVS